MEVFRGSWLEEITPRILLGHVGAIQKVSLRLFMLSVDVIQVSLCNHPSVQALFTSTLTILNHPHQLLHRVSKLRAVRNKGDFQIGKKSRTMGKKITSSESVSLFSTRETSVVIS